METTQEVVQNAIISNMKIATIGCNAKVAAALEDGDRREVRLARIMGMITGLIYGENEDGSTYICLSGKFRAQNTQSNAEIDGKPVEAFNTVFESGRCYLPPGCMETVIDACKRTGVIEPDATDKRSKKIEKALKKQVNFAFDVTVRRDKNASGITYVCRQILAPTEADPLEELARGVREFEQKLIAQQEKTEPVKALPGAAPKQLVGATHKR